MGEREGNLNKRKAITGALVLASIALVPGPQARADAISDFYAGKTVRVIIGTTAGGTYDLYLSLIHISEPTRPY